MENFLFLSNGLISKSPVKHFIIIIFVIKSKKPILYEFVDHLYRTSFMNLALDFMFLQISKCSMKYFCELSQCISISLFWLENWKFVKENKLGLSRKVDSFFKKKCSYGNRGLLLRFFRKKNSTQHNWAKYILKLLMNFCKPSIMIGWFWKNQFFELAIFEKNL